MRETGIVRRIDELGRVVIPKEIRKTQRIRTGDSLEIYTDGNGGVIFKKYSPLAELGDEVIIYQLKMSTQDKLAPIPGLQKDYEEDFKSALLKARGIVPD